MNSINLQDNRIIFSLFAVYSIVNVGLLLNFLHIEVNTLLDYLTLTSFSLLGGAIMSVLTMTLLSNPNKCECHH
jgi:hypothetical protein